MESFLSVLGLLLACLLVISAAVEATLEMFRGVLERLGFTFLKGKTSVEDAVKIAKEMGGGGNAALSVRLAAVESAVAQVSTLKAEKTKVIEDLKRDLAGVAGVAPEDLEARFATVLGDIKGRMDEDERSRVFLLKLLSILIGVGYVSFTGFNAVEIVVEGLKDSNLTLLASRFENLDTMFVNLFLGGIAAAAGSNYWHDALDRVRAAKEVLNAAK